MGKGKYVIKILSLSNISRGKDLLLFPQGNKSAGECRKELCQTNSLFEITNLVKREVA
jgi:hypothetical protein